MSFEERPFYDASFSRSAHDLTISLYGRPVATIRHFETAIVETGRNAAASQDLLFLRAQNRNGRTQAFFIDHEHGRTNVRQVSPRLESLAETLTWLLPAGYFARQGDVAFYAMRKVPAHAAEVSLVDFENRLLPLIGARHEIRSAEGCRFYASTQRLFLSVETTAPVVHPEHGLLLLSRGIYELRIARGRSLPRGAYVMQARTLLVGL